VLIISVFGLRRPGFEFASFANLAAGPAGADLSIILPSRVRVVPFAAMVLRGTRGKLRANIAGAAFKFIRQFQHFLW
jgi:hypothetical protein